MSELLQKNPFSVLLVTGAIDDIEKKRDRRHRKKQISVASKSGVPNLLQLEHIYK